MKILQCIYEFETMIYYSYIKSMFVHGVSEKNLNKFSDKLILEIDGLVTYTYAKGLLNKVDVKLILEFSNSFAKYP